MALVERAGVKNPARDVEAWQDQELRGKTRIEREVVDLHESNTPQTVIEYSPVVREFWAPSSSPGRWTVAIPGPCRGPRVSARPNPARGCPAFLVQAICC